jgi:hypothetical protein
MAGDSGSRLSVKVLSAQYFILKCDKSKGRTGL